MSTIKKQSSGIILSAIIALTAYILNEVFHADLLGVTIISLLIGMLLNPILLKYNFLSDGIDWTSKYILRMGIILTGITLSFSQLMQSGKYAMILLVFTLTTSFGMGYICSKVFKINWKLSSLLSVSTAICGGTAVATLGPTIKADNKDIAYAISATFIFDIITVIAFPWIGHMLGLTDTGFGLWVGTAVNDTSSVVAAGYAFSDAAGMLATIVKLTRTLFIVPVVIIFSWIFAKKEMNKQVESGFEKEKIEYFKIFPWFILGFIAMVALNSTGIVPTATVGNISFISKFCLAMALAAIGLKTSLKEVSGVGIKPMIAGVVIDTSVVIVAFFAQGFILRFF
ncbi:conserved hypothetical integral membrane protein [Anaerosphaera aminiphila DSM 21120]|uniref:Conserved hypothetical integral membrane protein n=1 Tax=Anaerosphaera aminiphila DSM 21120 TaxID=1120995 RepID=A0A1M5S0V6_9FIRM|nr:YeiH family protein [Anaerosphaera aminiphila]SHH32065.1 conserved hypothetical integral membrane protein [Anaerosphaera aminiphila DSM 21120]